MEYMTPFRAINRDAKGVIEPAPELDIRLGDWLWIPDYIYSLDLQFRAVEFYHYGQVIEFIEETDPLFRAIVRQEHGTTRSVRLTLDRDTVESRKGVAAHFGLEPDELGGDVFLLQAGVIVDKRATEAVRAAVANAAQEDAGQQRMFGG